MKKEDDRDDENARDAYKLETNIFKNKNSTTKMKIWNFPRPMRRNFNINFLYQKLSYIVPLNQTIEN